MSFQYVHDPRSTEVERRLESIKKNFSDQEVKTQINSFRKPERELLNGTIKPNKNFIKAYKERQAREKVEEEHNEYLKNIDEQGFKIEKVYNDNGYHSIHDPLNLYASKGNYNKLAWKVYNDVDESQAFLKTLYYPEIRKEDYNTLISLFSEEHRKIPTTQKFQALTSLAVFSSGIAVGNLLRFKMRTSFITGFALAGLSCCLIKSFSTKRMNSRLNSKAIDIAKNYPEIKLLNIKYEKINV